VADTASGEFVLCTSRTLYTSLEGASIHAADADKLHREEYVEIHPADAAAMRIDDGGDVSLFADGGELRLRCKITARVQEGVVFVSSYYDGGAVMALLNRNGRPQPVRVRVATPA
jgi:predicted molibdopterin-dependent oxidoreductase YjgC